MSFTDYTVVLGVDGKTINYLEKVVPSWLQHKPSLFKQPFVVFYDADSHNAAPVTNVLLERGDNIRFVSWPPEKGLVYGAANGEKWSNPQRAKMLAGFCYMNPYITTKYWLKLDLDVIASGQDDWIDPAWFDGDPVIVAPGWGYSKPPDIIQRLDAWYGRSYWPDQTKTPPLNYPIKPGADAVSHERICSWCAFFSTEFTRQCEYAAGSTCGRYKIPVDSQDTFHWYMAKRNNLLIKTAKMKQHGWVLRSTWSGLCGALKEHGF